MLREFVENIFRNYQSAKKEKFVDHPLVKQITEEVPSNLEDLTTNFGKYKIIGKAGQGKWTECPRISILNPRITEVVDSGYFVIYIFSADTQRLYLSLNQGIPKFEDISQKDHIGNLKSKADDYRNKLGDIPEGFEIEELSLGNPSFFRKFQSANICAKIYTLDDLPSEEILVSDLEEILGLYQKLIIVNEKGIRYYLSEILKKYLKVKDNITGNPLADVINNDFPNYLKAITPNADGYLFKSYPGKGKDPTCPWVAVLDPSITTTVYGGYYPFYIFKDDMKGVYLSLNQGVIRIDNPDDKEKKEILSLKAQEYRKILENVHKSFELESISVTEKNYQKYFKYGNILAKYYPAENLPSEEELEDDYQEILKLYYQLSHSNIGIRNFIKKVLENYLPAKNNIKLAKELVTFANGGDFHEYLMKIANQSGNDYGTYGDFGSSNNLVWLPYVQIWARYASSFNIRFVFREDMEGVYLSINQSPWTMDEKLKKKKLNVQKFSEDFQNHLKKEASEGRSKLRMITTIPDEFTEKIDLGSEMATSGPSIEAGNVFAKYYTLKNLPSEEELISDFKEILRLHKILETDPNINIIEPVELIFNKLPLAKKRQEKVKGHEVGNAFLDISNAIFKIAESINPRKSYNYQAYYQSHGNWYSRPYIYIEDESNKDKFGHWDQHYVGFMFTEDLSGVYLCLNQSGAYAESLLNVVDGELAKKGVQNYLECHANQIRKELNESVNEDEFLEETSKNVAFTDKIIYAKYYDKNDLPSNDQMITDFKKLFNLYSKVEPDENGGVCTEKKTFFEDLANKGYFFNQELVENFLLSLKVKPFIILTGNSGTGKTKLAQLFAEYLNPEAGKNTNNSLNTSILPLKRTITTYSKKHNGGWRFSPEEFQKIANKLHYEGITDFSKDIDLEINFNGRPLRGKGYIETRDVSYSPEQQSYIFYNENNEIHKELSQISSGTVTIDFGKCNEIKESIKKHEIVPVGANWTENRHIIGFYNVITEKYQGTEALDLILSTIHDTEEPYFLILDEMNLSHVERYFSDFLSAMESEEEIELHQAANKAGNDEIPPKKIKLSENLMVVGTVNVDETTYMFSPKVLDRANTLEFLTQGAEDYMSGSPNYSVKGDIDYLQNPLSDVDVTNEINIRTENIFQLKNRFNGVKTGDNKDLWSVLSANIGKFQDILKEADFDFGFRTINEIIRFMCVAWQYENRPSKWANWERYFDAQIIQKMLPKIHGSQKELSKVLEKLEQECADGNFPSSTKKIKKMRKTLKDKRYVSFTG